MHTMMTPKVFREVMQEKAEEERKKAAAANTPENVQAFLIGFALDVPIQHQDTMVRIGASVALQKLFAMTKEEADTAVEKIILNGGERNGVPSDMDY